MTPDNDPKTSAPRQSRTRWALGILGTVILAAIVAFASGFGSKIADDVGMSSKPLLSYSVEEEHGSCGAPTFLPKGEATEVLRQKVPEHWDSIGGRPQAALAGFDTVMVSIQGESNRTITLTGIEFEVTRHPIPQGGSFALPCGGPGTGRSISVDLDHTPPRILSSNRDPNAMTGSELNGRGEPSPIHFPWTVSVTDPLLLFVIAETKSCYCEWSARIPWVSGSERGTIDVDEPDHGLRVVGEHGYAQYLPALASHHPRRWEPVDYP